MRGVDRGRRAGPGGGSSLADDDSRDVTHGDRDVMDTAGDRDVMDTAGDVTRTGKRTGDATDGGRDGRGPASGGREGGTCAAPESVPVTSLGP